MINTNINRYKKGQTIVNIKVAVQINIDMMTRMRIRIGLKANIIMQLFVLM